MADPDPYRQFERKVREASERYKCGDEAPDLPRGLTAAILMLGATIELILEAPRLKGVDPEPLQLVNRAVHDMSVLGRPSKFLKPGRPVRGRPKRGLEDGITTTALAALAVIRQVEQGTDPKIAAEKTARELNTGTGSVRVTAGQLLRLRERIVERTASKYELEQYARVRATATGPGVDDSLLRGRAGDFPRQRDR
jgi:hypothetical protein